MLEVSNAWQVTLGSWAVTYLLHSSVLIGLAWGLTRLAWFRAPRTREVIWTVALFGGLATAGLATLDRTGGVEREVDVELRMVQGDRLQGQVDDRLRGIEWSGVRVARLDLEGEAADRLEGHGDDGVARLELPAADVRELKWQGDEADFPVFAGGPGEACRTALRAGRRGGDGWAESVGTACLPGGGVNWLLPLLGLWLLGVALLGWRELRGHTSLRRVRRGLEPASARVTCALARVVDGLGRVAVRAAVSEEVDAPCVVDSKTVVLPPRCQEELEDPELIAVLAHEVAHVCRRDVRRQAFFRWVAVAFWFQPLNRVVLTQLHDLAELICDDWAVGRIRQPLDLARSISRVAEWSAPGSRRQPVLASSQGGRLSERVRRILGSRRPGGPDGRLRGVLVAAALVLSLTQLPSVTVPGGVRAIFILGDEVRLEGADAFMEGASEGVIARGSLHRLRVMVRETES